MSSPKFLGSQVILRFFTVYGVGAHNPCCSRVQCNSKVEPMIDFSFNQKLIA